MFYKKEHDVICRQPMITRIRENSPALPLHPSTVSGISDKSDPLPGQGDNFFDE
jgi:hypothetical protein